MRTWPALRLSGLAAPATDHLTSTGDLLQATLADFPLAAIEEHSADEWTVFFPTPADRAHASRTIARVHPGVGIAELDVDDEDWAARSQASLRAIRAGRIVIAPPWDVPAGTGEVTVVIQPSMGFGTGHHASTRLCLQALQNVALEGRRVLDVGTGSGVLAIAASLLGAADVSAFDHDADAIDAARENLTLNPAARVQLEVADIRMLPGRDRLAEAGTESAASDVVLANITGAHLIAARAGLVALAKPAGTLILGGIMASEASDVLRHFEPCRLVARQEEDSWVCLTLEQRMEP